MSKHKSSNGAPGFEGGNTTTSRRGQVAPPPRRGWPDPKVHRNGLHVTQPPRSRRPSFLPRGRR